MINLIDGSHAVYPGTGDTRYGIDLRTHLAAMAMQGMLANPYMPKDNSFIDRAISYADDLIAGLNKEKYIPELKKTPKEGSNG